jgi:hypothetical protein
MKGRGWRSAHPGLLRDQPPRLSGMSPMIRWISDVWRGSAPVEFESSYGLSESVERLKAATRRSVFSGLTQQEAVGVVKESRVSLQRVIPMVGNSFKSFYRGRFIETNGKVILTDRFTMHWLVKVFMAVWFGAIGCFTLLTSILTAIHPQKATLAPLFGLGMIIAGTALVRTGKWFARNDAAWLSDVIRGALCPQAPVQSARTDTFTAGPNSSRQPSTTITAVTAALALMAMVCWSGAIFGIQSVYAGPNGLAVTYFPDMLSRYVAAGLGAAMLILAFGVYRLRLIAWRAGFGLLAGSWVYSVSKMLTIDNAQADHGTATIFCVASLVVTIIWIRWWYAQRIHFQHRVIG